MKRRVFLQTAAATAAMHLSDVSSFAHDKGPRSQIMTVSGEVAADKLGKMLPHEHVMVDFIGADKVSADRYDADEVYRTMLPFVKRAQSAGCKSIADCTPAYLGRDPRILRRLSEATGVNILTNTGYYGARGGMFLPLHVHSESAVNLANRWIKEWNSGIGDTGIRPGFIKIGVDAGGLPKVNQKLVKAAALCHLETGLTIAGHTGDGKAALEQVDILRRSGVSPRAWIWVHAQSDRNAEIHHRVARAGAWVEFDGVGPDSIDRHVEAVMSMRQAGLLDHVLLSHDAGWYSVGEQRGGKVRHIDTLFTEFLPALKRAGLSEDQITQLTVTNPAKAFSVGVRAA